MSLEPAVEHKQVIIRAEVEWFFGQPRKYKWWERLASRLGVRFADEGARFNQWLVDLIESQDMNIMAGPLIAHCDRTGLEGWSGTVIIETSHVAIHVWDKQSPVLVQLDFYTCGQLNTALIVEAIEQFGIVEKEGKKQIDMLTLDREYRLEVL